MSQPDRDEIIGRALRERRLSTDQVPEFRRLFDAQPAVMRHLLTASQEQGGLMPGLVAYRDNFEDATEESYDPAWLNNDERRALAARRSTAPQPSTAAHAGRAPATAAGAAAEDDAYDETMLSPKERVRIAAARAGTFDVGPVQFEDDAARSAAGASAAAR